MLEEGLTLEKEKTVKEDEAADKVASGTLEVYATPAMIGFIESTAQDCVLPHLNEGKTTVGIKVNVRHLKPTPIGMKVKCKVDLTKVEGKKLYFDVTAWDEEGKIGEGEHTRYIVDSEEFMKRVEK